MKGIEFPVALKQVSKFEKQNNEISVNVFGLDGREIVPLHRTWEKKVNHINLLLIEAGKDMYDSDDDSIMNCNDYHYVYIKNLSRLMSSSLARTKKKIDICDRCLHFFSTQQYLEAHLQQCKLINDCKVKLPKVGNDITFKNDRFKEKIPFVIYADRECLLIPINESEGDEEEDEPKNTTAYQKHDMFSIGYFLKCSYDDSLSRFSSYRGEEPALWFVKELKLIAEQIDNIYGNPIPMENLSLEQQISLNESDTCHICEKSIYGRIKVHDHCHLTSKYRRSAHAGCNLNYQDSRIIPVVFHNLSGYDAHFIIKDISNCFPGKVDLLPLRKEK
ncbi:uncharacterized protein LOC116416691 [Nasonia vitripennis]|uniref:DNA-directed DNA polymerase n=1 Tax=Nasonia vitripennis TaxID=7425 RepID=A0A7M7T880_NASVI|nr:uncharacterized protein LOC116416691 [Nasonia vitripennis]